MIFTFIIVNSLLSLYILFKKYIRYKSQKRLLFELHILVDLQAGLEKVGKKESPT